MGNIYIYHLVMGLLRGVKRLRSAISTELVMTRNGTKLVAGVDGHVGVLVMTAREMVVVAVVHRVVGLPRLDTTAVHVGAVRGSSGGGGVRRGCGESILASVEEQVRHHVAASASCDYVMVRDHFD